MVWVEQVLLETFSSLRLCNFGLSSGLISARKREGRGRGEMGGEKGRREERERKRVGERGWRESGGGDGDRDGIQDGRIIAIVEWMSSKNSSSEFRKGRRTTGGLFVLRQLEKKTLARQER